MSAAHAPTDNHLIARLPKDDLVRLDSRLQPCDLPLKLTLYNVHGPVDYVYFPTVGVVSAMTLLADGTAIEVATVGAEGVVGYSSFFGAAVSPHQVVVQVAGAGFRLSADALREECDRSPALRRLLVRYHTAFMVQVSQAVACNGLHPIQQRCCRWLLMTQDRVRTDELELTHEFLAVMLGVRRPSVTGVLQPLQDKGLIRLGRGKIDILDRAGLEAEACECYRVVQDEFARLFG